VINAYAPNVSQEKREFYDALADHVNVLDGESIVCGDFNCVLNNDLDVISGQPHCPNDIQSFKNMVTNCVLYDVWRLFHSEEKEYTWCRRNPFTARRLDYLFTTDGLFDKTLSCDMVSIPQSDHRLTD
jgi:exonuclease III